MANNIVLWPKVWKKTSLSPKKKNPAKTIVYSVVVLTVKGIPKCKVRIFAVVYLRYLCSRLHYMKASKKAD